MLAYCGPFRMENLLDSSLTNLQNFLLNQFDSNNNPPAGLGQLKTFYKFILSKGICIRVGDTKVDSGFSVMPPYYSGMSFSATNSDYNPNWPSLAFISIVE